MITFPRALTFVLLLVGAFPLTAAPAFNFPAAIADARRAWTSDGREIADLLRRLADASGKAAQLEDTLNRERKALADLRSGAFCTGCNRTRSDLLAHGEPFPHPGRQSRPATPEELAAAERNFDNRMDVVRRRIASLEPQLKSAQSDIMDAYHRLLSLIPAYHKHIAQEQASRLMKWIDEKTVAEAELTALHEAIAAQTGERGKAGDPEQARAAQERLDRFDRQLTQRLVSAKSAEDRARQEERIFRKDVLASFDYLAGLAQPIPDRYGANGWFIATNIRNPATPLGYTVIAVYVGGPSATVSDLQQLLRRQSNPAPKADGAKPPAGEKSVRDLLNGK